MKLITRRKVLRCNHELSDTFPAHTLSQSYNIQYKQPCANATDVNLPLYWFLFSTNCYSLGTDAIKISEVYEWDKQSTTKKCSHYIIGASFDSSICFHYLTLICLSSCLLGNIMSGLHIKSWRQGRWRKTDLVIHRHRFIVFLWVDTEYEVVCAYSNSTLFRDPVPSLVWSIVIVKHILELQLPSSPCDFFKKKCLFSNSSQVDESQRSGKGQGAGAAPTNPVCPSHAFFLPFYSYSASNTTSWFKSSVEQMQIFRNKQTNKQKPETTQATVIVSLNDESLKRLWKRASPHRFKTWYQTWGEPIISADFWVLPQSSIFFFFKLAGMTFRVDTASLHVAQRRSRDGERRQQLVEKQDTGTSASECVAQTQFFFFVFANTLMIKKKHVFGLNRNVPDVTHKPHRDTASQTTPPYSSWHFLSHQHHSSVLPFHSPKEVSSHKDWLGHMSRQKTEKWLLGQPLVPTAGHVVFSKEAAH